MMNQLEPCAEKALINCECKSQNYRSRDASCHDATKQDKLPSATMSYSCESPSGHLKHKPSINARMLEGIALHSNIYSHHRKVR